MDDWIQHARLFFDVPKPLHFTDYRHCCECAEHDQTLLAFDRDSIGWDQLGSPGWDPLCFSSPEGLVYYTPALIRLTLDGIENQSKSYLDQLLFHLIQDGKNNRLVTTCNTEQRNFIADFLEYLIINYAQQIGEATFLSDDILRAHEIWRVD
jgi:hypothetical protein